ncbi:acetylcholinesterase-like isoform X1 [Homalodisca vitripennis]|uniref:acetylcholinesterase-like isoform X1 n=1 Tax=Homalodisca vitripennis TaxID=197043 RepID=UPI001EEA41D9|nr:acetylcholinesterase-like isoform X1 [Homalodisca vitripennis]
MKSHQYLTMSDMSWYLSVGLVSAILAAASSEFVDLPVLVTKKGPIIGLRVDPNPATNISYDAYIGIPFGQIPGRFQVALPRAPWTDPRYTQKDGPACPQSSMAYDEDCLYLNVFTPMNASATHGILPVMVFIHGSGFLSSSSNSHWIGPDFLIPEHVILVAMNYRLGAPGFLTLGSKIAPGNLGLHDTRLALEWVRDEISVFGGDPTQVTLFGQSAGSAMTQFHYISSLSSDLFQRAIGHSGSALAGWSSYSLSEGVHRARLLAESLKCNMTQNDTMLLDCMQKADIKDVISNQYVQLSYDDYTVGSSFSISACA